MAAKAETQLVNNIKREVQQRYPDTFFFKVHGGPMQQAGIPDLVGCVRGTFVGMEVKLPEGDYGVTPLQEYTLKRITKAEGVTAVVRSVEQAVALLQAICDS